MGRGVPSVPRMFLLTGRRGGGGGGDAGSVLVAFWNTLEGEESSFPGEGAQLLDVPGFPQ